MNENPYQSPKDVEEEGIEDNDIWTPEDWVVGFIIFLLITDLVLIILLACGKLV
jgi:hypothetical protein